jgi:hypothetical protein
MSSFLGVHQIDTSHPPNDKELHDPFGGTVPTPLRSPSPLTIADGQQQEKYQEKDTERDLEATIKQRFKTKSSSALGPEEQLWDNDIVTFDSKDDPQNPKNWSPRRKALVIMLFGLTSS